MLEKSSGISVDYDGSMGFEVVDGLSNGYRIVAEFGRGQSDEAQMRRIRFSHGFSSLDYRWSDDRTSTLVRRTLSIEVDDVDDQG